MEHSIHIQTSSKPVDYERGSTLIAVLLILLVITVLGVMAMRQGLTSLGISTNAQVSQILVQSADTPLNQFLSTDLRTITSLTGVIGAALAPGADPLQETVFCYRPTSSQGFGNSVNANTIKATSGSDVATLISGVASGSGASGGGFCDLGADYGSSRKATVTQVAVTIPTDASSLSPGSNLPSNGTNVSLGQSLPQGTVSTQRIRVTSTAMLPAFSTTDLTTVQNTCIGKTDGTVAGRINDNTDPSLATTETVTDCLARLGVPANTQVQEYKLTSTLTQTQ